MTPPTPKKTPDEIAAAGERETAVQRILLERAHAIDDAEAAADVAPDDRSDPRDPVTLSPEELRAQMLAEDAEAAAGEEADVVSLLDNLLLATMINARFSAVQAGLMLAQTEMVAPGAIVLPRAAKQFAAAMGSYNALAAELYPDAAEGAPAPERTPAPQKLPENACPRCKGTGKIMVPVPGKGGRKVIAPHVCSVCAGSGTRPEQREQVEESTEGFERPAQQQEEVECAACKGKKKIVGADFKLTECPTCGGRGVVSVIPSGRTPYPEQDDDETAQ